MSNSLWPRGPRHARPPCPSLNLEFTQTHVQSSWWCLPTILSPVVPFSSCLQSFPKSGSFPMSQFFASGGQNIAASALASVLPMNFQDWFPLRLTGFISCSPRDSQESSPTPQFKSISSSVLSFVYSPTLTSIRDYWKNHSFDWMHLCWQSNVSPFNALSRFVIAFLPKSKHLLISRLQSPSAMILEPKKIKSVTVSIVSPSILPWREWTRCHDLSFLNV